MNTSASIDRPLLSIVVPVYRGRDFIRPMVERVHAALDPLNVRSELMFVDDHCPEGSWSVIQSVCAENKWVQGIRLSRNFGQHNAITAGMAHACGEWVVIMDCDLQDRPEEIPRLFKKAQEGFHLVRARRKVRQDKWIKRQSSSLFNRVFSYLTGTRKNPEIANFGIYHHDVVQAVLSMGDRVRFTPSLVEWVGFREAQIDVEHAARESGTSSYSWFKLFSLALDNAVAFSLKPLHLTLRLGFLLAGTALLMTAYTIWQKLYGQIEVPGYASIIISIWFLSGVIVSVLGVVGLYVGYAFLNTKTRPLYVISETTK